MWKTFCAAVLLATLGCGSSDDSTGPGNSDPLCTISISGAAAIAGTYTCLSAPITLWVPSTNTSAVSLNISGQTKSITGLFVFSGKPTAGATYTSANSTGLQSYGFVVNVGTATWEFSAGQQNAPLGSGSLTFTSVEPLATNVNGSVYDAHGTIDANLVPGPGTTATGNATLHVVF